MALGLILVEGSKEATDKESSKVKPEETAKNKRSLPLLLGEAWSEDLNQEYLGGSSEEWALPRPCDQGIVGTEEFNVAPLEVIPKTITIVKETRVPVPVEKQIPYPVYKEVPYPVHVKVPQPYPVEKKVLVPVKVTHEVPEIVHKPFPVEKIVKVPVEVSFFKIFFSFKIFVNAKDSLTFLYSVYSEKIRGMCCRSKLTPHILST